MFPDLTRIHTVGDLEGMPEILTVQQEQMQRHIRNLWLVRQWSFMEAEAGAAEDRITTTRPETEGLDRKALQV